MSSSVPVQQGGVIVVTQMYPSPPQGGFVCYPVPQQMCTGTSTFIRAHPLALGTVQIMIGLMVFSFGLISAVGGDSLAVYNGFFVWGAGFYITAGSLTVAAGKSSNRCLMNTTLAFNVIATLSACTATIFYAIDAVVMNYCSHDGSYDCFMYQTHRQGLSSVLAVFHFLEFIVTIVVSAFACKSTCNCCRQEQQHQQSAYIIPGNASMAPQAPPSYSPAPATVVQLPPQGLPTFPAASTSMAHPPPPMMNVSSPANGQSFPGPTDPLLALYEAGYSEEIKRS